MEQEQTTLQRTYFLSLSISYTVQKFWRLKWQHSVYLDYRQTIYRKKKVILSEELIIIDSTDKFLYDEAQF